MDTTTSRPLCSPSSKQVHGRINTVAESYFQRHDFGGDVILHAAVAHPLLKRLVRLNAAPDSLMRADDRADALSRYFEPRVYQRRERRKTLCLATLFSWKRTRFIGAFHKG